MNSFHRGAFYQLLIVTFCVTFISWLSGCQDAHGPGKLVPVVGKVTLDGEPLKTGSVSFRPDKAKGNETLHEPGGEIDETGTYKLFTASKEGAPPGWYKVIVTSAEPIDPNNPYAITKSYIDNRYNAVETSGLAFEVVEKPAAGAYDLSLLKKMPAVPARR